MQRLVTNEDLIIYPQLQQMGVSANQHFDFSHIEPKQRGYSNSDYDISEYTPVDYGNFKPKPKEPLKKWTKSLDKIYVINLAKRKDRMLNAVNQLNKYSIPFERIEAIEHEQGAEGLRLTMEKLFKACIKEKFERVLVFEDDLDIIEPTINDVMQKVMDNLPPDFDIIYLGTQLCAQPTKFFNRHMIQVNHAFATHAAIYSLKAMKHIIKHKMIAPIDNWLTQHLQNNNLCFATYPMLVSQIVGKSDIYNDVDSVDWKVHLENKFYEMTKHLPRTNG